MRSKALLLSIFCLTLLQPTVYSDAAVGDRIITLGADLSAADREKMLNQFTHKPEDTVIEVTNADERQALSGILPGSVIGNRAISCTLLTFLEKGAGLQVTVDATNITYVSQGIYQNALLTAGLTDVSAQVSAPFPVSGTAALTGITKAFEQATGKELGDARKDAANKEMVETGKLGEAIGNKELAASLLSRLKEEIAKQKPQTDEDYRRIIEAIAAEFGVTLTEVDIERLITLLKQLQSLNIDWSQLGNQIEDLQKKWDEFAQNQPEKVNAIVAFFQQLWNAFSQLFQSLVGK